MPSVAQTQTEAPSVIGTIKATLHSTHLSNGQAQPSLFEQYSSFENTPAIGTEFRSYSTDGRPLLTIADVLKDEAKLKQLAILVSERGVVFFRSAAITPDEQITLVDSLGRLTGKPADSTLHVHPLTAAGSELGDEISVISNQYVFDPKYQRPSQATTAAGKKLWHTDITFETKPSDFACLQIREFPENGGGDTLWASGYEAYDRLSPALRGFLETLTATHAAPGFLEAAKAAGTPVRENRGSPDNKGQHLTASHPVIRTNPVTGWKSLFVNRGFTKRINELSQEESENLLEYLFEHIASNHDFQVRFRWEQDNLAIWSNTSAFHAATYDLGESKRVGTRAVSIGEKPYFDPKSKSRREALAERAAAAASA